MKRFVAVGLLSAEYTRQWLGSKDLRPNIISIFFTILSLEMQAFSFSLHLGRHTQVEDSINEAY